MLHDKKKLMAITFKLETFIIENYFLRNFLQLCKQSTEIIFYVILS